LLALGRQRIAHVTGPEDFAAVALRIAGWQRALAEAGRAPWAAPIRGDWSEGFGYETGLRLGALFRQNTGPDAVFCGNDQIARGMIDALHVRGIRVPDDIAVVGYDNWEIFAQATRPPLTTVDMALKELGRVAGLTLLEMIDGKPVDRGIRRLPCRLTVRRSCGAPPEDESLS
jgi:LacI family transcriptional regulator